jgi:hypothetical protein
MIPTCLEGSFSPSSSKMRIAPVTAPPTEPGCVSHSSDLIVGQSRALAAQVELMDDRSPPRDHRCLDVGRAGRAGVRRRLQRGGLREARHPLIARACLARTCRDQGRDFQRTALLGTAAQ